MRTRVQGKAVIREGGEGTIRWAIEAHGAALSLFRAHDRNDMVREAVIDGGKFYVAVFLPKNFTDYALRKGYRISGKYDQQKDRMIRRGVIQGPEEPLVYTGLTRQAALTRSTVTGIATSGRQAVLIKVPIPPHGNTKSGKYGIAKIVSATLRSMMPWEVERVAEVVQISLVRGLTGAMEQRFQGPPAPPVRQVALGNRRAKAVQGNARKVA